MTNSNFLKILCCSMAISYALPNLMNANEANAMHAYYLVDGQLEKSNNTLKEMHLFDLTQRFEKTGDAQDARNLYYATKGAIETCNDENKARNILDALNLGYFYFRNSTRQFFIITNKNHEIIGYSWSANRVDDDGWMTRYFNIMEGKKENPNVNIFIEC